MKKRRIEKVYIITDFSYDGEYPCLCMGHLKMTIDGVKWDFGHYCLSSGGSCGFIGDYEDSYIETGDWRIIDWPKKFPEDPILRKLVEDKVNSEIRHGCCGGCL